MLVDQHQEQVLVTFIILESLEERKELEIIIKT